MGWVDAYSQGPFELDVDADAYIGTVFLYVIPLCVLPLALPVAWGIKQCTREAPAKPAGVAVAVAAGVAAAVIAAMLIWQTVMLANATPVGTVVTGLQTGFIETVDAVKAVSSGLVADVEGVSTESCSDDVRQGIENIGTQFTTITARLEVALAEATDWLDDIAAVRSYDRDVQIYGPLAAGLLLFTFVLYGSLWAAGVAKGCAASIPAIIATIILWAVAIVATVAAIMFADLCAHADAVVLRAGGDQPQLRYYIECTGTEPEAAIGTALHQAKTSITALSDAVNNGQNGQAAGECTERITELLAAVNGRLDIVETETGCGHIQSEYVAVRETLCSQPFTTVLEVHQATVTALFFAVGFFMLLVLTPRQGQGGKR